MHKTALTPVPPARRSTLSVLLALAIGQSAEAQGIPDAGYDFIPLTQPGLGGIGGEDLADSGFIAGRVGESACAFAFCAYVGRMAAPPSVAMTGLMLPVPAGHEARFEARAVNATGRATGWLDLGLNAFRWDGAQTIPLPGLGAPGAQGDAINDLGVIGGWAADPAYAGESHAVLWTTDNQIVPLDDFGGMYSRVRDLNNLGEACGEALTRAGFEHAYIHSAAGVMLDLGTLGGFESRAWALNEKGTVVGRSLNAALAYIPFVWDSALGMRPLPVPPGAAAGGALGVNDDGLIVGEGTLPIGGIAALWDGPTVYDLNTLRAPNTSPVLLQSAIAINNEGWILCRSGPTSGVLLRPRSCYPDCTGDGALSVSDFGCFQTEFVLGSRYADCNQDGTRTVADFGCFQTKFVAGCP